MVNSSSICASSLLIRKVQLPGSMLREVEEEASKLVSKSFCDTLWLTKAREELDKLKGQLTESNYKAFVLVLNAQIVERITCITGSIYDDRIYPLIVKLDFVIKESERMARTPALDHFQAYAKCVLLQRVGDFLLSRHSRVTFISKLSLATSKRSIS
ncbi:hypothetical protein Tcan_03513 [Toxocara canis]|uniref:Uncharacterized protein n=1 Tax=Toxocara canis TaxID=6265 RepID=A0A0B2V2Z9_TOXCA|nr:hypothetical protein Tcan_03513 [Toxocara canis]